MEDICFQCWPFLDIGAAAATTVEPLPVVAIELSPTARMPAAAPNPLFSGFVDTGDDVTMLAEVVDDDGGDYGPVLCAAVLEDV